MCLVDLAGEAIVSLFEIGKGSGEEVVEIDVRSMHANSARSAFSLNVHAS